MGYRLPGLSAGWKSHARYGIFARDPKFEDFMVSSPAQAAGHKIQWGFEKKNSEQQCRDIIAGYTRAGGDRGVGSKYIRMACGLKPSHPESASDALKTALADSQGDSQGDKEQGGDDPMLAVSAY